MAGTTIFSTMAITTTCKTNQINPRLGLKVGEARIKSS
jgi:hypothetical protein